MATALLFLSGCSQEQEGEIKRLAMPVASTKEAPLHPRPVDVVVAGRDGHRRRGVGPDLLRRDPLPPPQRDRDPGADALQPADRDLLHDRAGHDGDRLLLLHRRHPEQGAATSTRTPTRTSRSWASSGRGRSTTTSAYDKDNERLRVDDGDGEVVHEGGTTADRPTLWLVKDKSVTFTLDSPDVIHSFWVPGFLFKMDVVPGRHNHFTLTPDALGHLRGPLRRAVRRLPLADAVQRQGRRPGGVRRAPRRARRAGQHRSGAGSLADRPDARPGRPKKALEESSDCRLRRPRGHTRPPAQPHARARSSSASSPPPTTS